MQIFIVLEDDFVADDHGEVLAVSGLWYEQPSATLFKYCHLNKDHEWSRVAWQLSVQGRHWEKSLKECHSLNSPCRCSLYLFNMFVLP